MLQFCCNHDVNEWWKHTIIASTQAAYSSIYYIYSSFDSRSPFADNLLDVQDATNNTTEQVYSMCTHRPYCNMAAIMSTGDEY